MFRSLFQHGRNQTARVISIDVAELKRRLDAGEPLYLLDVRSAEEYAHDGRIAGAHLLPLPALNTRSDELPKDVPIICVCRSGHRSSVAAAQLARKGFTNLVNLTGGMSAWLRAGLPAQRG